MIHLAYEGREHIELLRLQGSTWHPKPYRPHVSVSLGCRNLKALSRRGWPSLYVFRWWNLNWGQVFGSCPMRAETLNSLNPALNPKLNPNSTKPSQGGAHPDQGTLGTAPSERNPMNQSRMLKCPNPTTTGRKQRNCTGEPNTKLSLNSSFAFALPFRHRRFHRGGLHFTTLTLG